MKKKIEIKGECELIQIDPFQFFEDKQRWKSGETTNCNIYFQKKECKFVSKDVVISYDALKIFNDGLMQIINSGKGNYFFYDENRIISLRCEIDRHSFSPIVVTEDSIYLLEFNFFYYKGSDIKLSGYLLSNRESLKQTIEQIGFLL
ncbi:hypothetical protein [Commensalibacter papalotli (ex Botero et al. 2024)]|uniref:Uncharacterized protein n=1 Tax=Commensalibacter papalotli (ex Botero et al. 2024) TaxID=2972766 RepID=A0ABM9HU48_9PROT|nr:hypothetical protein [Commensalibacter papalotli (ex Botero et al. 2024)]CAI3957412.1 unnamed protein product [Commensalibacter papalotli (ex Botero et al. 2024)]CAI3958049.1 unnamed protein product [Commensalibacter papalotli (ex Botero et al. 2024)]